MKASLRLSRADARYFGTRPQCLRTAFRHLVVDVLLAMGYGGWQDAAFVTPASNDGGVDGIIDQDALGLSKIYVQAKRYAKDNVVGRPALQSFVGALHGKATQECSSRRLLYV